MDLMELARKLAALLTAHGQVIETPEHGQEGGSSLAQDVATASTEPGGQAERARGPERCWEQPRDPDSQAALRNQLRKILVDAGSWPPT